MIKGKTNDLEHMDAKFFKKLGRRISSLGMGTWGIGGGFWHADDSGDEESIRAMRRGIELGINVIDTAEMYGAGHAEELVKESIAGLEREELFIVTKVWQTHAKYEDVIKSARASARRLGTYIDLYLLHWPSTEVPICETMKAMESIVVDGIARNIGVSNFDLDSLKQARACLSKTDISAVQNKFNLLNREDEKTIIPYAEREGMLYIAYTPIAKGALTDNSFLTSIGAKYGKSAVQIALNWLICINSVIPIPRASKLTHMEENAGAMGWRLRQDDWDAISREFR
ncbi:MAG: aldo/keto reductase [Candidatus Bathyarchaeia archaeon]